MLHDHEGQKLLAAERQEQLRRDATDPLPWWAQILRREAPRVTKELLVQALRDLKTEKERADRLEARVKELEAALEKGVTLTEY
jgi:hypothetical protein